MRQIYFLTALLFLIFVPLNAQTVNLTDSCASWVNGDYSLSLIINGKPSYRHSGGGFQYLIRWNNLRWEHVSLSDGGGVGSYNYLDTPTPPATSLSPWTPALCNPTGIFSGDGTTTTLSVTEFDRNKIKVYPNPSSDFIKIDGLFQPENYKIYNILGTEVKNGTVSNSMQINIRNFTNGLYFLKFTRGNAIKFIKE
jgi:hypothetical protein